MEKNSSSDKLRMGLIGLGNIGRTHAEMLKGGECPDVELAAVAEANPKGLEWAKETVSRAARFSSADDMLDSGLIDAVLVATPHPSHPELAMKCMERGLHVLIEKPAGMYVKQVHEMNDVAKKSGVVFGIMFNQRTNHIYRKMRELVQNGELGNIRRTNWIITDWYRPQAYFDSSAWKATWAGEGGGVLMNQCPHNLDLWQWICGMPVKVDAHMHFGKWHDIEVEDDVTAYVEYPNGATGTFITSTGDAPGSNRFEITLDGGKLVAEDDKLKLWKLEKLEPEFNKSNKEPFAVPENSCIEVKTDGKSSKHAGVINAFAGAVLRGEPLVAEGVEGINELTLANAMHLSAWMRKPVDLPLDEELHFQELMKRVKTSKQKTNVVEVVADTKGTYGS